MLLGVGLHEFLWLALALLVGGMISGVLAGLFGVSGGSVIVPVLYEGFRVLGVPEDVRMQLCLGTSIAIVVPTTIRSYLTHRAKGLVIPGVIRQLGVARHRGRCVCSAAIAAFAPAAVLTLAFRRDRHVHRDQAFVRRRPLEPRRRIARHGADGALRFRHRACAVR